jgi:hypothetical protein
LWFDLRVIGAYRRSRGRERLSFDVLRLVSVPPPDPGARMQNVEKARATGRRSTFCTDAVQNVARARASPPRSTFCIRPGPVPSPPAVHRRRRPHTTAAQREPRNEPEPVEALYDAPGAPQTFIPRAGLEC